MKTKNTILLSLGNKFDMFQNHRNQDFQSLEEWWIFSYNQRSVQFYIYEHELNKRK